MKIHLYNRNRDEAFRLSEQTLLKMGFAIHNTDFKSGMINATRTTSVDLNTTFLDVYVGRNKSAVVLSLFSNIFSSAAGIFMNDSGSEESFLDAFYEISRIQPPANPFRLSFNDYAMAVGF